MLGAAVGPLEMLGSYVGDVGEDVFQ